MFSSFDVPHRHSEKVITELLLDPLYKLGETLASSLKETNLNISFFPTCHTVLYCYHSFLISTKLTAIYLHTT